MNPEVNASVVLKDGRRGVIRYYGMVNFNTGKWVGIELNTPDGKNNGSVQGTHYFTCKPNHGVFVKDSAASFLEITPSSQSPAKKSPGTPSRVSSRSPLGNSPRSKPSKIPVSSHAGSRPVSRTSRDETKSPKPIENAKVSEKTTETAPPKENVTPAIEVAKEKESIELDQENEEEHAESRGEPGEESGEKEESEKDLDLETEEDLGLEEEEEEEEEKENKDGDNAEETQPALAPAPATPATVQAVLSQADALEQQSSALVSEAQAGIFRVPSISFSTPVKVVEHEESVSEQAGLQFRVKELEGEVHTLTAQFEKVKEARELKERELKQAVAARAKLEEEVGDMAEAMELLTLEKEECSEKVDELTAALTLSQERIEELELDKELLMAENEVSPDAAAVALVPAAAGTGGEEVSSLLAQQEKLKEALVLLRDERAEHLRMISELEKDSYALKQLQTTAKTQATALSHAEAEIEMLKENLDAALQSEELVNELTEKTLAQDETIAELQQTIRDLEDTVAVSNELEEEQNAYVNKLQTSIRAENERSTSLTIKLDEANKLIRTLSDTIVKYKELAAQLRTELETAATQGTALSDDQSVLKQQSQALIKKNALLNAQLSRFVEVSAQLKGAEVDSALLRKEIALLKEYLPSQFHTQDSTPLAFLLAAEKVAQLSVVVNTIFSDNALKDPALPPSLQFDPPHSSDLVEFDFRLLSLSAYAALLAYASEHVPTHVFPTVAANHHVHEIGQLEAGLRQLLALLATEPQRVTAALGENTLHLTRWGELVQTHLARVGGLYSDKPLLFPPSLSTLPFFISTGFQVQRCLEQLVVLSSTLSISLPDILAAENAQPDDSSPSPSSPGSESGQSPDILREFLLPAARRLLQLHKRLLVLRSVVKRRQLKPSAQSSICEVLDEIANSHEHIEEQLHTIDISSPSHPEPEGGDEEGASPSSSESDLFVLPPEISGILQEIHGSVELLESLAEDITIGEHDELEGPGSSTLQPGTSSGSLAPTTPPPGGEPSAPQQRGLALREQALLLDDLQQQAETQRVEVAELLHLLRGLERDNTELKTQNDLLRKKHADASKAEELFVVARKMWTKEKKDYEDALAKMQDTLRVLEEEKLQLPKAMAQDLTPGRRSAPPSQAGDGVAALIGSSPGIPTASEAHALKVGLQYLSTSNAVLRLRESHSRLARTHIPPLLPTTTSPLTLTSSTIPRPSLLSVAPLQRKRL